MKHTDDNSIEESGIILTFPDNRFFRLQDCAGYKEIQDNFKEMDVCWYDEQENVLYLIELKDWHDGKLDEENNSNKTPTEIEELRRKITNSRINTLLKKSIDSVFMFVSVLLNKPYSSKIQKCSPFTITKDTEIALLSIINWSNSDLGYISTVHSSYKTKFAPYAKLLKIKKFLVLTKEQAHSQYPWVILPQN